MKNINTCWIFDVDGVITNIEKEVVTEPSILDFIIKILEKGEPVAFNTGRGIEWVKKTVLDPLKAKISNPQILQNLFVIAESGGINTTFSQNGSLAFKVDESLKIPSELDQEVRKLVRAKYSNNMRYEDKKTMITTKIKEGGSIEQYQKDQQCIAKDLQGLINQYGLTDKLKVALTTIGADIMYNTAGKDRGVELILDLLRKKGIKPKIFVAFGDSISDIPMAEKLYQNGHNTKLVYVGKNSLPKLNYPFKITRTKNVYSKGTEEFLKSLYESGF